MSEFRSLASEVSRETLEAVFPAVYRVLQQQSEVEERVFQESRRGLEESRYQNESLNRELKNTLVQIESLEDLTGKLLEELANVGDNFRSDWGSSAGGLFGVKKPEVRPGAQKTDKKSTLVEKPGKVKPKSALSGAGKAMGYFAIITVALEMIDRIRALDPKDPEYYSKARNEVAALVARFGAASAAAVLGGIAGTALLPGPGSIVGFASGLAAGLYVDYAFGEDVETMTKQLLDYIFKDNPSSKPVQKQSGQADLPSPGASPMAYTPDATGLTKLSNDESMSLQKNWLQSLVEGNFKSLNFEANSILFDADFIDWGAGGGAGGSTTTPDSYDESQDRSKGGMTGSKMPSLAGPRSSGATPESGYTHTPNKTVKMSSGVTPQSSAVGTTTPNSTNNWAGHTYTGDHADILATIRDKESSGGNYTARSSSSSASGAYQFINSTWRSLTEKFGIGKEYRTAADAPPQVQDAVAAAYVADILRRNNNDLSKVPLEWYTGNSSGTMSQSAIDANGGQTGNAYVDDWMRRYYKITGKNPQMVGNQPQTGTMMNTTAMNQQVRASTENQPAMLPVMARTGSANPTAGASTSVTSFMQGNRREPSAADLFRALFNVRAVQ